jgi:hypothetical protein
MTHVCIGGNKRGEGTEEERIEENGEKIKEREIKEKYTDSIHYGADQTAIYLSAGQHVSP